MVLVERQGSGRAFLYVLYLDGPTGENRTWVLNTDYLKIELKSPDESPTTPEQNGLSSVNGVDTNNDGKIDYLYAGDRRGNLWKVDASSATPSSSRTPATTCHSTTRRGGAGCRRLAGALAADFGDPARRRQTDRRWPPASRDDLAR